MKLTKSKLNRFFWKRFRLEILKTAEKSEKRDEEIMKKAIKKV